MVRLLRDVAASDLQCEDLPGQQRVCGEHRAAEVTGQGKGDWGLLDRGEGEEAGAHLQAWAVPAGAWASRQSLAQWPGGRPEWGAQCE